MPGLNVLHHTSDGAATPLLIVHGLFGSARNWGAIARRLSDRGPVLAVDMRNHGDSPHLPAHDYPALAADLAQVIAANGGKMDLLGHSMGGKAAMMLALTRPEMVGRLIVADIAPVRYGHSQSHLIAAMRALDLCDPALRGGGGRAVADRMLQAQVDDPQVRAFLLQSLDLKSDPVRWRLNLDALDAQMDHVLGWPDPAGQFDGPALFLAGGASDYVQRGHRAAIKPLFPAARIARIPGAGHWLHAEAPRAFEAAVRTFLA